MEGFLLLGFFIGMSHALEADHLAAVGTLTTSGKATPKRLAALGASWGLGHTATLLLLSLPALLFGVVLSVRLAAGMEFLVGIMLVGLGLHVFWKIRRKKIHFHVHDHGGSIKHFHAHNHAGATIPHKQDKHLHEHRIGFSPRAFVIGLAHGAAGSAGLTALAIATTQDSVTALTYVMTFGIGSVLGMALLTYTASWPLQFAETSATRVFKYAQFAVATAAVVVGGRVITETAQILFGAV